MMPKESFLQNPALCLRQGQARCRSQCRRNVNKAAFLQYKAFQKLRASQPQECPGAFVPGSKTMGRTGFYLVFLVHNHDALLRFHRQIHIL